jgi:hypothetical protein
LPKKRNSVLSLIRAWVEKHKEVNFVSSNWSSNEKKCVQCKSDIGISVNEETGLFLFQTLLVIVRPVRVK